MITSLEIPKPQITSELKVLTINPTWRCPVNCSYCHITEKASLEDTQIINIELLKSELEKASKLGFKEIRFSGGEPLVIGEKLFELAELVYQTTGIKPSLLTSGLGLNSKWASKAQGKFSAIYVSVENPLEPIQTVVNNKEIIQFMKENSSKDLPLTYGLTLITSKHFKNIKKIFDILYEGVDKKFLPQLDYPCLKDFIKPNSSELLDITTSTRQIFSKYGLIPYYFVNLIGSPIFLNNDIERIVINLQPDGKYDIYDTLDSAVDHAYSMKNYTHKTQHISSTCQKCSWKSVCKFHESGRVKYDWCELRMAIFKGIYEGWKINKNQSEQDSVGTALLRFIKSDAKIQRKLKLVSCNTSMSSGTT